MTSKKIRTCEMKMTQKGHRPIGCQGRAGYNPLKLNLFFKRCLNSFAGCLVKMGNLTRSLTAQLPVDRIFVASSQGQKLA
ncbi:MAG: hypothetical protein K0Q55_838 [Verrucomicrobia bacterium]|jgi:hypothetical protein|nr:hypothetical protein [Verrucomicrobiota bacterium]